MIIIFILFNIYFTLVHSELCTNSSEIVQTIFKNYAKYQVPGGKAEVTVEIWIDEILNIFNWELQMDFILSEIWSDPGLAFEQLEPCEQNISLTKEFANEIWTPNIVILNTKSRYPELNKDVFVMLFSNGTVWTTTNKNIATTCHFDLSTYPFDYATCSLVFQSFNYNADQVTLHWAQPYSVLQFKERKDLTDFKLDKIENYRTDPKYVFGRWNELTSKITFHRLPGYYIINYYIPTFLAVTVSWLSISFGSKSLAGRSLLCIGSFILIAIISLIINNNMPRVSYMKAIDIWIIGCQLFVFLILVELAIIGIITRKQSQITHDNGNDDGDTLLGNKTKKSKKKKGCCNKIPCTSICMLDTVAGFGIAALFVIFVIVYWVMYSG